MLLIYGAYGYTGRLILGVALARGLRPVLSGRDAAAVQSLAAEHALEARPVALNDAAALRDALHDITVVLHCAGPFSATSRPMVSACIAAGVHYLDITGEVEVFEACAARSAEANAGNVMLLPGTGFDVVPSDCLAAHLKARMPHAQSLSLGFRSLGGLSRGTALTMAENLGRPAAIRRNGRITKVPTDYDVRRIDFGDGERLAVTIKWGDVSTAYYSTGIPDIRVYMSIAQKQLRSLRLAKWFGWFLRTPWMQHKLATRIRAGKAGPSDAARERSRSLLWGEITDANGMTLVSRISAPDGYTLTADTAVRCAMRALAGDAPPGFQTPSLAYGADFILEAAGVARSDDPPTR